MREGTDWGSILSAMVGGRIDLDGSTLTVRFAGCEAVQVTCESPRSWGPGQFYAGTFWDEAAACDRLERGDHDLDRYVRAGVLSPPTVLDGDPYWLADDVERLFNHHLDGVATFLNPGVDWFLGHLRGLSLQTAAGCELLRELAEEHKQDCGCAVCAGRGRGYYPHVLATHAGACRDFVEVLSGPGDGPEPPAPAPNSLAADVHQLGRLAAEAAQICERFADATQGHGGDCLCVGCNVFADPADWEGHRWQLATLAERTGSGAAVAGAEAVNVTADVSAD